jgi:hypothetical protein
VSGCKIGWIIFWGILLFLVNCYALACHQPPIKSLGCQVCSWIKIFNFNKKKIHIKICNIYTPNIEWSAFEVEKYGLDFNMWFYIDTFLFMNFFFGILVRTQYIIYYSFFYKKDAILKKNLNQKNL